MSNYHDKQANLRIYVEQHFTDSLNRSNKTVCNRLLRAVDDSNLWPIRGRFNATERAIRKYQRLCNQYNQELADCVYSYVETINQFISEIVNDPDNW